MTLEIGERVVFRSLHWEVEETGSSSTVRLFGRDRENHGRHATVLLGVEPIERAATPEVAWTLGRLGWDRLKWKALHNAFRLTLAHGRGSLASADWGRLILEPYQLVPLQRLEGLPFPRLLIADDTGLGKTAEAGLILLRLLERRRADRVLVLTRARPEPERWKDEIREKFGIDFTVVNDGADYARLRRDVPAHLNVFGHLPRLIVSMYYAAQDHVVDDLRRDVRWDVVIIDEAHHVSERGDGEKKLAELGRVVAERTEALLLLTATPHDGKAESFASLLRLLDPYVVLDPDRLDPALVGPLVVRRLKPSVVRADGSRFLRRRIQVLEVEPSKEERWLDRGVRGYCRALRERAKVLAAEGQRSRAMGASFLESFLRKRAGSSAFACAESLGRRLEKLTGITPTPDGDEVPEDRDDRALAEDEVELPSGKTEREVVQDLLKRAARVPRGEEAKATALVKLLQRVLASPSEKVIVFTEFVDTLEMLATVLEGVGWREAPEPGTAPDGDADLFIRYHGGTRPKSREAIRKAFLTEPRLRILLATDAASESINLQMGCNNVVHYETAWNPNRYEQRNGRVDRYGQTAEPRVYLLITRGSLEERVASVGYAKLERIAEQVGSVSNVLPLASRVSVEDFLDAEGEEAEAAAARTMEERIERAAALVREDDERDGTADLVRGEAFETAALASIESALARTRELTPEYRDVEEFLDVFLRAEGGRLEAHPEDPDLRSIRVPPALRHETPGERIERATFRRDVALRDADRETAVRPEFLSPGHPLVRAALRRVRGWVHQPGFASRVDYRRVAPGSPPGFVFTFASRFLDGRGEVVEERFEAVFAGLDGTVSTSSDDDLRRFLDRGLEVQNPTDEEERILHTAYAGTFAASAARAASEVGRRARVRIEELERDQRRIVEDALIRLGRFQKEAEDRLRRQGDSLPRAARPVQLDFDGKAAQEIARLARERERRLRQFRAEQADLLAREAARRQEIRAMETIRLDSIDPIGALALVPEGAEGSRS